MAVNRDRSIYNQRTKNFVKALAQVFCDGDEDAAWERWFKEADEVEKITGIEVDPASPGIMLSRVRRPIPQEKTHIQ